jgi:4-hydroxybenzoate polyprenyltransferase
MTDTSASDTRRVWRHKLSLYLDLIRWDRPAGWLLLLWPSLSALWVACEGWPGWHLLSVFVLGTILMRSAGCCVNDVADRDFDKHVKRTAQRPVTRGALSVREALIVGAVLALLAFGLVLTTHAVAVAWSFVGLAATLVYPYAKRHVAMPQAVLGIAFSFGIPMAFAVVNGADVAWQNLTWQTWWPVVWQAVPLQAWGLMVFNLFWVLAYDTEYAMVDRDDDLHIGMKTSAITLGEWDVRAVMLFYALHLLGWYALLSPLGLGVPWQVACVLAVAQVVWHYRLIRDRTREGCFKAFRLNHWLGATLFAGIVLGFALR